MKTKTNMRQEAMFPIDVAGERYYVTYDALKEFVTRGIASPVELWLYNMAKDIFEPTSNYINLTDC